jgi:hypothetical protein
MNIPKTFKLASQKWRVVIVKRKMAGYGECDFATRTIRIAASVEGKATSDSERLQTFLHEWWHAYEHVTGQDVSEPQAVLFENLMYETLLTMRGVQNEI